MGSGRLGPGDVACWVLKTATAPSALAPGWAPGGELRLHRCLHPTYRLGLMAPGDRCLLWLSGARGPGVHAVGALAAPPGEDGRVEVVLHRLEEPLPRAELLTEPAFAGAEVVRVPVGGNPSYLTAAQLAPVLARLDATARRSWAPGR